MNRIDVAVDQYLYIQNKRHKKFLRRSRWWNYFSLVVTVFTGVMIIAGDFNPRFYILGAWGIGIVCVQAFFYNLTEIRKSKRRERELENG